VPKCGHTLEEKDITIARYYTRAVDLITTNTYDLILLDHRMPHDYLGDLEEKNIRQYSDQLMNIGYLLVPLIKNSNPSTLLIGTSSFRKEEIKISPLPDHHISKMWGDAEQQLEAVLKKHYQKGQ